MSQYCSAHASIKVKATGEYIKMLNLIAQAESIAKNAENMPVWAQVAGGIGSFGFAVWYAYYTTKHTIPKLNRDHAETVRQITAEHCKTTDKLVDEFREESKEQREYCQRRADQSVELARTGANALHEVTKAVERLTDRVDIVCGHNQLRR